MNLREFTALIRLYQACSDAAVRTRAVELVPELAEWGEAGMGDAKRWLLRAFGPNDSDLEIDHRTVVCRKADLNAHCDEFRASLELIAGVRVTAKLI